MNNLSKKYLEEELSKYIGIILFFANKTYCKSHIVDKEDIIQAGIIGMIKGLEKYDVKKANNSKKTSYISQCIKNNIYKEANKFKNDSIDIELLSLTSKTPLKSTESFLEDTTLSTFEKQILSLRIEGATNKDISKKFNICERTAQNYTLSAFKKIKDF